MNILINISGVYKDEGWTPSDAISLDLEDLHGCCCYCAPEAESTIRQAIAPYPAAGLHWIDTGDYHYISKLWMEKLEEPFILALFDNHPDDQESAFGSLLSCGSWVLAARRDLPLMKADYLNPSGILEKLPVYLSIDMDVLPRQYARTDWDQGEMTPDGLLTAIDRIAEGHRILGADICGGLSSAKGALAEDLAVNSRTRELLDSYFKELFARGGMR